MQPVWRWAAVTSLAMLSLIPLRPALAQTALGAVEVSGSGFLTIAAGRVLGGSHDAASDLGWRCPCFVSDYAQGGVYESGAWRFGPDSKLGLQGHASIENGRYALTGQIVSRGARKGRVDLEWLYATAELNSALTLQVGRKRLPLFQSSEVQDIGYALPWTHLPPQIYGWEVVNFNGASLNWQTDVGPWLAHLNVFAGAETARDSGVPRIYEGKELQVDVRWSGLRGAELKLSRGGLDLRAMALSSRTQDRYVSLGESEFSAPTRQRMMGASANLDVDDWIARLEWLYVDRHESYGAERAQLLAVGRRMGPWLGMLTAGRLAQRLNAATRESGEVEQAFTVWAATLRRELGPGRALKLQYDQWRDQSRPGYRSPHGNARLLSTAYEQVF